MNIAVLGRGALPRLVRLLLFAACALLAAARPAAPLAVVGGATAPTPSCPTPAAGNDYTGLTLVLCNFNKANLQSAKFKNATLTAVVFDGADLRSADFSGATFADSGDANLPTDFSFANLENASFNGAKFNGLTYLTYATLTCADFSNTDISTTNAVFGPSPLRIDKNGTGCRPPRTRTTFAYAVMNCEFVADWNVLDMSHATGLQACAAQLLQHDFSGAGLDFADLSGINLSGTTWTGASLRRTSFKDSRLDNAKGLDGASKTLLAGAIFQNASAKLVNFSGAKLNGVDFSRAELSSANFAGATLVDDPLDPLGPITVAATFENAHLQYVNFSSASLNSVNFKYASLYGAMTLGAPPSSCQTDTTQCGSYPVTGATCSCATLSNANLTRTDFSNAFLYGVDFGSSNANTKINGTTFSGAVLVAANFGGAAFTSQEGQAASLDGAWLQGANLQGATLANVSLSGAYVDFGVVNADGSARPSGRLALLLTTNHTKFRDWAGSLTPCVYVENPNASSLPTDIGSMTCPDGGSYTSGCGALLPRDNSAGGTPRPPVPPPCQTPTTNSLWCAGSVSSAVGIVGWYRRQSTYENAATATSQCNGQPQEMKW